MKHIVQCTALLTILIQTTPLWAIESDEEQQSAVDLSEPTLYVVGYAHLDTQWRWSYIDTIRDFIPSTLNDNFALFEKYPSYVFNFGGSRRYEMMKEYYPQGYEQMLEYVKDGRWFPCGSSVDENDANVPSAESQIRHALYGNRYFDAELGMTSDEFMLPDCFGFPAGLPSVLAHCGIKGFSTQKLTWNAVVPIPFKVGVWEGPDGRSVIAALDPGSYSGDVRENLANSDGWYQRIKNNGDQSGVYVDYHYYGTGDIGGAPKEASVAMIEQSVQTGKLDSAKINVISSTAEAMFNAISPEQEALLPRYRGELELTQHSAGSVTSQSYMKRWNRKNELLADAAEKAAVGAWWLGSGDYPAARLQSAWQLVLGSQMHDILPGTSVPLAYDLSWNDEVIAANQFGAMLTTAASVVISKMDTQIQGTGDGASIVVYNPLSWERTETIEAQVPFHGTAPTSVVVTDPTGNQTPAQVLHAEDGIAHVAFTATVPSIGYSAYTVKPGSASNTSKASTLHISSNGRLLENKRYIVKLDTNGDVSSVMDKQLHKELLAEPARIGLFYENPSQWPAWNQDWSDRIKPATSFVGDEGHVQFKVIENGAARVAVEVTRQAEGSTFIQTIRLSKDSDRVEFDTIVDWNTRERSVRAAFPLTAQNPNATYDIQIGTTEHGNSHETQYEYSFHQWVDLTDTSGQYGASVLCDSKYGTDKPSDNTLRLTLLFTPGVRGGYPDQQSQDLGRHHILYALQGHASDWRDGQSYRQAAELNEPMVPFRTNAHDGALGKSFSLAQVDNPAVSVQALKKAEDTNEVIVRLREQTGHDVQGVRIAVGSKVLSAREIDGQERPMGDAQVSNGVLVTDIGGYELRAYALTLAEPSASDTAQPIISTPMVLAFDSDTMSTNQDTTDGAMNADGRTYPAEQMPETLRVDGVNFSLANGMNNGQNNTITAQGQQIKLPAGDFDHVYLLVASSEGDVESTLTLGSKSAPMPVQAWDGFIGQWDHREWPGDTRDPRYPWGSTDIIGLTPGYIKQSEIAWHVSHQHILADDATSTDAFYEYSYVYKIGFELPKGATSLTLPDDRRVKIFAVTLTNEGRDTCVAAAPLFDTLEDHLPTPPTIIMANTDPATNDVFTDSVAVKVQPGMYWEAGSFYYTTDGTAPTTHSPVYTQPIMLSDSTTIRVAALGDDGKLGPIASKTIRVNDQTPPSVNRVLGLFESPEIKISFSEPITGLKASNLTIEPSTQVREVSLSNDGQSATIILAKTPSIDQAYTLSVEGVTDTSPTHNTIKPVKIAFEIAGPVFTLNDIGPDQIGTSISDVAGLPVNSHDHWTINFFTKMNKQPTNHTVLVGFGNPNARAGGQGRYLCKFANGVQLWSHNADAPGNEQYDLGRWQMITATFDGSTVRLYKDTKQIGARKVGLSDDENVINIAPLDPWDRRYRFEGELAGLTIWDTALEEPGINALMTTGPE